MPLRGQLPDYNNPHLILEFVDSAWDGIWTGWQFTWQTQNCLWTVIAKEEMSGATFHQWHWMDTITSDINPQSTCHYLTKCKHTLLCWEFPSESKKMVTREIMNLPNSSKYSTVCWTTKGTDWCVVSLMTTSRGEPKILWGSGPILFPPCFTFTDDNDCCKET